MSSELTELKSGDGSTFLLYDLHSHTTMSDGRLTPEELVLRASSMRVGVLAITDHDTTDALAAARLAIEAHQLPLHLVNGVEISTAWESFDIHIVGLNVDPGAQAMVKLLASQGQKRSERAEEIGRRLEKNRIPDALAGAKRCAGEAGITRAHFARYLIEAGIASDMVQVFKNYMVKGKPGYVPPPWCLIEEAVSAIHAAGGQAVLAHPGRYGLSAKWLKRLIAEFKSVGGDAIEVAQCQQPQNERTQLAAYAREYGLLASQGSDFHYPCAWLELGRRLWLPAGVTPVWHDWPR